MTTRHVPTPSEKRVLDLVMRQGALTQRQIMDATGITQQYLSKLVKGLQVEGLLRRGERVQSGRRGQPGINIKIDPTYTYSLGISLMSDALSLALMDFSGATVQADTVRPKTMSQADVLNSLQESFQKLLELEGLTKEDICGVGAGVTGFFIGPEAKFNTPPALDDWALVNVVEILKKELDLPVWADNDGNVAAIHEMMTGVGRWAGSFAYLFFSYGFGGGIIVDGKLMRGALGNAGEFAGVLPLNTYRTNLESLRREINSHGMNIKNVSELVDTFDINWPGVEDWIDYVKDSLSMLSRITSSILDPDAIVLGGRIPESLATKLIETIHFPDAPRRGHYHPRPKVVLSEAKGDSTASGAAMLPLKHLFYGTRY